MSRRRRRDDDRVGTDAGSQDLDGRCAHCGEDAIVWDATRPKPGARPDLNVMPICLACGRPVDLNPPEPAAGTCLTCGGAVTWGLSSDPRRGWIAVCAVHGPTQTHVAPQPERQPYEVSFSPIPAPEAARPRRRGLTQADVRGVVRTSRPTSSRRQVMDPLNFGNP
jgi:hypothetical protein